MGILNQGLILMVTGMGAVFAFLIVLFYVVKAFEAIAPNICHILPDPAPKAAAPKAKPSADAAVALAIAVALKRAGR
jgi:sodium pump decarboxylase gamma subunit